MKAAGVLLGICLAVTYGLRLDSFQISVCTDRSE